MTEKKLGEILWEMYNNVPKGYQVVNIHLFGVKYATVIFENDFSVRNIVSASGLKISYVTEVNKG